MKNYLYILLATLALTSCEKVIEVKTDGNNNTIVIEGNITNTPPPYYVKVTNSVPYTQSNVFPPVTNALVIITTNNGVRDTLTHTANGIYKTNKIIGTPGTTYNLSVATNNTTYTAQSKMPNVVVLDSLRSISLKFRDEIQYNVIPVYTDAQIFGNGYRFIQWINGVQDKTYIVWNDNTNNGLVNQRPIRTRDADVKIKVGDLVKVEMRCIDENVYAYFYTLQELVGGGLGGGATPTNPPNNLSNGALGIFSAHTTQEKSMIVR